MHAINILDDDDRTLVWQHTPAPIAGPGEVLVENHATAVNRADLLQRLGGYAPPPGASAILGLECAGVVTGIGEGVDRSLLGQRVASLLSGGGYAEKVAVPAAHLLKLPDDMPFTTAAAIPEVFYTAYLNLCIEGAIRTGETALIHAAASGVGTAALQICREMGCPTIATASGSKLDTLSALGATHSVDRREQSFDAVVAKTTNGRGVDVILDPVAADYLERNIASLALGGRLVVIGLLSGTRANLDLGTLLRRRLRIVGSVLRSRTGDEKTEITHRFRTDVWPWLCDRTIEPVIDHVLPVAEAGAAHQLLRSNQTTGKVVLKIR